MSIAVDTKNSNSTTAASTLSVDLTLSAGTGRLLVMGVAIATGAGLPTINTPTWAGSSTGVTQQDSTRTGPGSIFRSAIYTLANPTSGTNTFQATLSAAADEFFVLAIAFTGVKQTGSVVTSTGATGSNSTAVASITPSGIVNYLVDLANMWGSTLTAANYQTEQTKQTLLSDVSAGLSTLTNVQGLVPMTWTETGGGGNEWTYHIIELAQGGPSFSAEPSDVTIIAGNTTVLSVTATAESGSLTYQWQVNTGSGFVDVSDGSGGTTSSYTTATLQAGMRFYRCNVTDSIATNPTRSAQVTILSATPEAWVTA